jgi:translocator protein
MKNWIKLVISLLVPQITGASAALFTVTGTGSWYQQIKRPEWNPPNWVFAPVWTLLYIMMGIAFFLIWKTNAPVEKKRTAMGLWAVQLFLNFLWSFIFFYKHHIGLAVAEILCLWIFIILTIFSFSKISKMAAWLLVPYICWVSFAGLLTYTIWNLNQ